MSQQSTRAGAPGTGAAHEAAHEAARGAGAAAGFVLALLPMLLTSLRAQEPPVEPSAEASKRAATTARPTPNADNESDDSDRRPLQRKTISQKLADGGEVKVAFGLPKVGAREYVEMESLPPGKVVRFFDAAAMKLSTGRDLMFGDTTIRAGNVAPSYPGVYSLWLQRTADGWRLLFNEKADVWGTQHDPAADVASAPLVYDVDDDPATGFEGSIQGAPASDGSWLLTFQWGKHRWKANFRGAP